MEEQPKENIFTHVLRYEIDQHNRQACFYVSQSPESNHHSSHSKFLWQSQKWQLTIYDESKIRLPVKRKKFTRRFVRRTKSSEEGQKYIVTEILNKVPQRLYATGKTIREFMWKPKDIGVEESFLLVAFDEDSNARTQSLLEESELTKSFTASYGATVSTHEDFESTYNESDEEMLLNSIQQPVGGLARLTYTTEKLIHLVDESKNDLFMIKPVNVRLHFEEPELWIDPYDGNYGMEASQIQISERFGNSIESSLVKLFKRGRGGGYLSDFSMSLSDMRRTKRYRKRSEMEKPLYSDLPSDVVVVDVLKETRQSDDEDFEDLSIDYDNVMMKNSQVGRKEPNTEKANYEETPTTLLSIKDEFVYNKVSSRAKTQTIEKPKTTKPSKDKNQFLLKDVSEKLAAPRKTDSSHYLNEDSKTVKVDLKQEILILNDQSKHTEEGETLLKDYQSSRKLTTEETPGLLDNPNFKRPNEANGRASKTAPHHNRQDSDRCDSGYEENVDQASPRSDQRLFEKKSDSSEEDFVVDFISPMPDYITKHQENEEILPQKEKSLFRDVEKNNLKEDRSITIETVVCQPYEKPLLRKIESNNPLTTQIVHDEPEIMPIVESSAFHIDLSMFDNEELLEDSFCQSFKEYKETSPKFITQNVEDESIQPRERSNLPIKIDESNDSVISKTLAVPVIQCQPYERIIPKNADTNKTCRSKIVENEQEIMPVTQPVAFHTNLSVLEEDTATDELSSSSNERFEEYSLSSQAFVIQHLEEEVTLSNKQNISMLANNMDDSEAQNPIAVQTVLCQPYERISYTNIKTKESSTPKVLKTEAEIQPTIKPLHSSLSTVDDNELDDILNDPVQFENFIQPPSFITENIEDELVRDKNLFPPKSNSKINPEAQNISQIQSIFCQPYEKSVPKNTKIENVLSRQLAADEYEIVPTKESSSFHAEFSIIYDDKTINELSRESETPESLVIENKSDNEMLENTAKDNDYKDFEQLKVVDHKSDIIVLSQEDEGTLPKDSRHLINKTSINNSSSSHSSPLLVSDVVLTTTLLDIDCQEDSTPVHVKEGKQQLMVEEDKNNESINNDPTLSIRTLSTSGIGEGRSNNPSSTSELQYTSTDFLDSSSITTEEMVSKTSLFPNCRREPITTENEESEGLSSREKDIRKLKPKEDYVDLDADVEIKPHAKKSVSKKAKNFVLKKLHIGKSEKEKEHKPKIDRETSFKRFRASVGKKKNLFSKSQSMIDAPTPRTGFVGLQRLKYDDDEDGPNTRTATIPRSQIPQTETQTAKPGFYRSRSFDSLLDQKDETEKLRQQQLRERRRRLAGYSYVSREDIPDAVIKGRDYSTPEIIAKETEKELAYVRKERRRTLSRANSLDQLDDPRIGEMGERRRQELDDVRKHRRKGLGKGAQSMDVSMDAVNRFKQIGRIAIPSVFLSSHRNRDRQAQCNVGKVHIPHAFSIDE